MIRHFLWPASFYPHTWGEYSKYLYGLFSEWGLVRSKVLKAVLGQMVKAGNGYLSLQEFFNHFDCFFKFPDNSLDLLIVRMFKVLDYAVNAID